MQIFNLMDQQGLTPNQFYLLYCIRENVQSVGININQEIRQLVLNKFLIQKDINIISGIMSSMEYEITPEGENILSKVESYFKVQKKKTDTIVMGPDFTENITKYNELFPKEILPSKKYARVPVKILETNFKWFFENHSYSWDTILRATAGYIDEMERETPRFRYLKTAAYFICKTSSDKIKISILAERCYMLESGVDTEELSNHFKDIVT